MADAKLSALTGVSVPAAADLLYLVDVSDTTDDAAGSSRSVTVERLLGVLNHVCQGRLTLESGVPISTSDQTGKTTVYFAPYGGNLVSLYDGTRWKLYPFTERSLALGTLTSGKNYDVFLYDNAGTLTLELSAAWTNDTTRADALATQDGVYVKDGATTRRYLGTIRTTATTTTEDSLAKRFCWNANNRVRRPVRVTDATNSWTYASATIRYANGSAANRAEVVAGQAVSPISLTLRVVEGGSTGYAVYIGVDSGTTFSADSIGNYVNYTAAAGNGGASLDGTVALGWHYYSWLDACPNAGSHTVYGDDGGSGTQSGITGGYEC